MPLSIGFPAYRILHGSTLQNQGPVPKVMDAVD